MSDASDEEVERIREQKRQELLDQADGGADSGSGTPTEPVHVESEDHFERLVAEHDTVLVDYYADWCGPCRMLEPTVEEIAAEGHAVVAKVDIDAHQQLAQRAGVRGVPTLKLLSGGQEVQQWVGVQDKGTLVSGIQQSA